MIRSRILVVTLGPVGIPILLGILACRLAWNPTPALVPTASTALSASPTPTEFPYPIGLRNAAGVVPGVTTFEEVKNRFGEPTSAGSGIEAWWFSDILFDDELIHNYQADMIVFVKESTVVELQILYDPTQSTLTAEKVIASYGVPPYVELANPQGTDLQAPAWSQLVYPEYGLYIELRCTSLLSVGCDGVRKDDPVNRIDYFIPRPVPEYFRQRQEMFPNGSWFTIVPWPGLQEEIKP